MRRTAVPDSSRPVTLLAEKGPMESEYFLHGLHLLEQVNCIIRATIAPV
jgi:hypothetical protein